MPRYFIVLWLFCVVDAGDANMGVKLIILLGLLIGVLYSIHILVQDYQALTAAKLLRFLFKRDVTSQNLVKPSVRWKRILFHDPIQCARYLYCEMGARPPNNEVARGLIYMLTLQPKAEDKAAHTIFNKAYNQGRVHAGSNHCKNDFSLCPFSAPLLLKLVEYMLKE